VLNIINYSEGREQERKRGGNGHCYNYNRYLAKREWVKPLKKFRSFFLFGIKYFQARNWEFLKKKR